MIELNLQCSYYEQFVSPGVSITFVISAVKGGVGRCDHKRGPFPLGRGGGGGGGSFIPFPPEKLEI